MVLNITYPANQAECFAKGNFSSGSYFEVPAIFDANGQCDEVATLQCAEQFEQFLIANIQRPAG